MWCAFYLFGRLVVVCNLDTQKKCCTHFRHQPSCALIIEVRFAVCGSAVFKVYLIQMTKLTHLSLSPGQNDYINNLSGQNEHGLIIFKKHKKNCEQQTPSSGYQCLWCLQKASFRLLCSVWVFEPGASSAINPLMPRRYIVPLLNFSFRKPMLQGANTDLINPLVPKAHNKECQDLLFSLKIKPLKSVKLIGGFLFLHPSH